MNKAIEDPAAPADSKINWPELYAELYKNRAGSSSKSDWADYVDATLHAIRCLSLLGERGPTKSASLTQSSRDQLREITTACINMMWDNYMLYHK